MKAEKCFRANIFISLIIKLVSIMCGRWLAMSQDEDIESYWSIGQKHSSKTMYGHDRHFLCSMTHTESFLLYESV